MSVIAITGLVLGATTAEKRSAREQLQVLLAQTKHSAETLQTAFLPEPLPQHAGLRGDVLYIAAEREALIGGDWYDAFDLPGGRVAFSIGDVTGHGLEAAVSASRLRRSIFVAALEAEDPAEILTKADGAVASRQDAPATAMIAILSRDLRSVTYASAGHPPPIVAGPEHPRAYAGMRRPAVWHRHSDRVANAHGSIGTRRNALRFHTDGLTEFKRDIAWAERTLLAAMTRLVNEPNIERPAAFIQRSIMGSERPADDTVLVVVQLGVALEKSWSYDSRNVQTRGAPGAARDRQLRTAPLEANRRGTCSLRGALHHRRSDAFANTVEHAPGPARVSVDWTGINPVVTIADGGPGLSRFVPRLPADPLNENGRGLFLIASLASDVQIETNARIGTKLRIVLPTRRARAAANSDDD